jgi:L-threonylcarbamoyladenylate synthase
MKIPKKIVEILKSGGVGVLPTDTIYGILGSALKKETIERIYKIRKREKTKPFIILISKVSDLKIFGIKIKPFQKKLIKKFWPGPTSLIFDCKEKKFSYLHRGKKGLAFRIPKLKWLRKLLEKTGPLVAPSCNIAGKEPARTIKEAKQYFGRKVDFYVDGGRIKKRPSSLIDIRKKKIKILRK